MLDIQIPPEVKQKLIIIGIMGGICAGKSTIAQMFEQLGAHRIDADQIANQVLLQPEIQQKIVEWWGTDLLVDPKIQRKRLAEIVFADPVKLKQLEDLLHPIIRAEMKQRLYELSSQSKKAYIVLDAALLWESGLHQLCDCLIFVESSGALRNERAMSQRNWNMHEIEAREQHQAALNAKKAYAHHIIQNHGSLTEVMQSVQIIWQKLQSGQ